jgi:hypothetical protein
MPGNIDLRHSQDEQNNTFQQKRTPAKVGDILKDKEQ